MEDGINYQRWVKPKIINLTNKDYNVVNNHGDTIASFPAYDGKNPYVEFERIPVEFETDELNKVPFLKEQLVAVQKLPKADDTKIYLVCRQVRFFARYILGRNDFVEPFNAVPEKNSPNVVNCKALCF